MSETLRTERCAVVAVSTDGRTTSRDFANFETVVVLSVVVVAGLIGAGSEGKRESGSSVSGERMD